MKQHWLDQPRNVKTLRRASCAVLALTLAAEREITLHPHFAIESVFGFAAWFGFAACAAMIVLAKGLAVLLKRPDTYYSERDGDE